MESTLIRKTFLDFFGERGHEIVDSAPMVIKNDPTLMFTNAGMNQFKENFLGQAEPSHLRVANTQKCLRVSGKHNDLDEVGVDTYHHTMFEMLGNWSFGDYFKKETIRWAYELLVDTYGIDADKLYVTYFKGDEKDGLKADTETRDLWKNYFSEDRVLGFGKAENFWEMGDTGPCGPCSEIHIDLRSDEERKKIQATGLINRSHPLVIELWNLVFIEFNRKEDLSLAPLPQKHVDTGMGLERLSVALQSVSSNYDTDIFMDLIKGLEKELNGPVYSFSSGQKDVAFRVVVDHVRAVSVAIAEGQMPSNTGAGYVIRRILRRAVRYAYSFLGSREPIICKLVPYFVKKLGPVFGELSTQASLIQKVVREEEESFLHTLEKGIDRFEKYLKGHPGTAQIDGRFAFELYDTYGFPVDLTEVMAIENKVSGGVDKAGFEALLDQQKVRSRAATKIEAGDWQVLLDGVSGEFSGYDQTESTARIAQYRKVKQGKKDLFQLVFDVTPFYPEGGGQVGDTGHIASGPERIEILDTRKESNLILHIAEKLPSDTGGEFSAVVDAERRMRIMKNHSATHLLHRALREVLGTHVEQKGSLVHPDYLRFDFSHFEKIPDDKLREIEAMVNEDIRRDISMEELREIPLDKARKMGAMALFGEKYGSKVRVIRFGQSVELCGGTHVVNTGEIGNFRILSEGSVAAGIRRIEAVTGLAADAYIAEKLKVLEEVRTLLNNTGDVTSALKKLIEDHNAASAELEMIRKERLQQAGAALLESPKLMGKVKVVIREVSLGAGEIRDLVLGSSKKDPDLFICLASKDAGKAIISVGIGKGVLKEYGLSAKELIRSIAPLIDGAGGGQDHFATAGGKKKDGLKQALSKAEEILAGIVK